METHENSVLKFYLSTTDQIDHKLLYEQIVHLAKQHGISGATVYRGVMGFGKTSHILNSRFWELTEKLPVMIEMIDKTELLEDFYDELEPLLLGVPKGCLVTMHPIHIKLYKSGAK
jgi:PII-like signaling protein